MKKTLLTVLSIATALSLFAGSSQTLAAKAWTGQAVKSSASVAYHDFKYKVDPTTFDIVVEREGIKEHVSVPLKPRAVRDVKKTVDRIEWTYPNDKVKVIVQKKNNKYLDIRIQSIGAEQFAWPTVQADNYMLPLGEGKRIPANDKNWKQFLKEEKMTWGESFSMNFMALNKKHYSLLFIIENPFNNEVSFQTKQKIGMTFEHEFPSINPKKEYGFRLYITDNDPVAVAKQYKEYVKEHQGFKSLEDKAKDNPEIKKLFGAPHIYLWNNQALESGNIRWQKIRNKLNEPIWSWIAELAERYAGGEAEQLDSVLNEMKQQQFANNYQKRIIVDTLNQVLKLKQLYLSDYFPVLDDAAKQAVAGGVEKLSEQKLYELNKNLLKSVFQDAIDDPEEWGRDQSNVLEEMRQMGIEKAWIGLPNWSNGLMNPAFVAKANKQGYLIGPYDSYHSIQKNEDKEWNTAFFPDSTLYEQATISNKKGVKIGGFLDRGRKLNPTFSLPSVKQRVEDILQDGILYNSWFIDCDATGEVYDDYTPDHITTQEQDEAARLNRMDYIAKEKHMVIGSEGGHDFASSTIAFAHGIETPVIKWNDKDMRENKESPYYVGGYGAAQGSIPERYVKQVPVKELYQHVYLDPAYSLPLFKLVYNNSVITTHHWEWGSLKIKDEVGSRMLYELLYNVPPLYHLDSQEWDNNKELISSYLKVWSPFHAKAVTQEMTAYKVLTPDRLLQSAEYGPNLKVVVNFSNKGLKHGHETIKARSAVIYDGKKRVTFNGNM
ncbi:glycoside hydrolase [Paenibacillus donghaensis]|uniref:glycoside hydrolase n=1 Tax=Paenibacillus donghaensis TaxID=414771 RepID=UPI0018837A69|nr:glycoside hydrolase [Paenibacillus donghaensis]MBE9915901.1 glycoside hydrolase [Paenibacillus donghaensis]